jgi:hypothetical protein
MQMRSRYVRNPGTLADLPGRLLDAAGHFFKSVLSCMGTRKAEIRISILHLC